MSVLRLAMLGFQKEEPVNVRLVTDVTQCANLRVTVADAQGLAENPSQQFVRVSARENVNVGK